MAGRLRDLFKKDPGAGGGPRATLGFLKKKGVIILLVAIVFFFIMFDSMFVYVRPNEFGIKVVKIGADRGVQEDVYTAGYHFVLPFGVHQMHRLPRDTQVLELSNYEGTAASLARIERAAHIQTSDGFFVDVDVSILYRIADPYKVFTLIGPGRSFENNGIIPKAEPALKETLGELTTEEFYNSHLRVERTQEAEEKLRAELAPKGIQVDHVLVRYFKYSDEIQKNIEEKKLQDQLVFKNQAEKRAAAEAATLMKVIREGEMNVKIKISEGEAYVTRRNAEIDQYVRTKRAQADLLVKLAEAKKTELRNSALQGSGSDRMVGLRMAKVLKGLDMIVLPSDGPGGVNPLDMAGMLNLFEVRKSDSIAPAARPDAAADAR
jgi:regulator of protease activity HflC (stomatin/prohibitin superfamily)